jgi:AraC-like DNA-binding protein
LVQGTISKVELNNQEVDTLLRQCHIPPTLLNEPQARVSLAQFGQLLSRLMNACNDELLGHGSVPVPVGNLSILSHYLIAAGTMGQALHRLVRYNEIQHSGYKLRPELGEELISIDIDTSASTRSSDNYLMEFAFWSIHRMLCWLSKEIFPIHHLYFPFEEPSYSRDYRLMFYGAPVSFNNRFGRITFAKELLQKPVVQDMVGLKALLDEPFRYLLALNFTGDSWASRVADYIRPSLNHLPTLPELAEALKIAPYTLQRRLSDEGVSYLMIKNQVKRDRAIELLVHSEMSIEDISAELGFSETSPFTRTFKGWTGLPPSAYRRRL